NYFLGIDFGTKAVSLQTLVDGTLNQAAPQAVDTLQANKSQLLHVVLSADLGGVPVDAAVRMTIYDAGGNVVFTVAAPAGATISRNVFLAAGVYTVRFAAATRDGTPLPNLRYKVRGESLTDPMGMESSDTTATPAGGSSDSVNPDSSYDWSSGA